MRLLRFLGGLLLALLRFLRGLIVGIITELLQMIRALIVFVPMLIVGLMMFMFFQESLSMEQADIFGQIIIAFLMGALTGFILRGRVNRFWRDQ